MSVESIYNIPTLYMLYTNCILLCILSGIQKRRLIQVL
jgi:hypothetical protein